MSVAERTIDRLVAEAEETLIGLYGEPTFEDEHTETLQAVIGPMADALRGAVEALSEIAERTDVPADFANAAVRLRWASSRAANAVAALALPRTDQTNTEATNG